jgi:hypothetical protein
MIAYTPPRAAASIPVVDLGGSFSAHLEDRHQVAFKRSYGYSQTEVKRGIHT